MLHTVWCVCVSDAAVTAAAAAVSASQGRRCVVIPGQSEATVQQSAGSVQQISRHNERV